MFLKKSQFKASTLCASSALLVLGGFMTINLAGCGGGGGGGSIIRPVPTAGPQNVIFRLILQNQDVAGGGTVTLTPTTGAALTATANSSGIATLPSVPAGTYNLKFTVFDSAGRPLSTTNSTINISRASGQSFLLIQDQGAGNTGDLTVSGTIRLNPRATPVPTPTGTPSGTPAPTGTPDPFQFSNCNANSAVVTGPLLVEAIDLDTGQGRPIVAQLNRSNGPGNQGRYTIKLPYSSFRGRPATFQIRIGKSTVLGEDYAGLSSAFNFNGQKTLSNVDICVNNNGNTPQIPATTVFTPQPTFTFQTPIPTTTITNPNN